jgi:mannonate dehydratase
MADQNALTRRGFASFAAAAAPAAAARRPLEEWAPGIKLSVQVPAEPSDDDLKFVRQVGAQFVNIPGGGERTGYQLYARLKQKVEAAGLKVWNIGNSNVHNMPEVTLNLPGRDKKIEEYKQFLRDLAKAGIYYTTYAHMGNGIWSSERETTRGGAGARAFDASKNPKGYWVGKVFEGELTHGRKYSKEEIWENFIYFVKQVKPVAEELGMRIGIHPDDPPVPELGGIPRCIFGSFDGYRRALEIADSPNIGMCLCCGCWLEGGKMMGKDVVETIHFFGKQKKLFKVHFRNVNQPYPHFVETFMDAGYMNMYKIMKALRDVDFRGCVIGDHFPEMVGGRYASVAYGVAYMKALLERANEEAGGKRS